MISLAGRDILHSWGKFVFTGVGLGLLIGVTLVMAGVYRGMVDDGQALLAPSVTRRMIAEVVAARTAHRLSPKELATLTPREREVLELVAAGRSNAEIAAALFVGDQTVKTHVSNVLAKLGLRDRAQAVVYAYETGVVTSG